MLDKCPVKMPQILQTSVNVNNFVPVSFHKVSTNGANEEVIFLGLIVSQR